MHSFLPVPNLHYRPCQLHEGAEWFISFYVTDPATSKLKRIRIKVNRVKSVPERRRKAKQMMASIDQRLSVGWNPLIEEKAPKGYAALFAALDSFLKVKKKETEPNTMRCYVSFIRIFKEWLSGHGFNAKSFAVSVDHATAIEFLSDMEQKFSPKTYNNYLNFYKGLFNWLTEKGYAQRNPFEGISKKPRRLIKKNRRMLTDEELSRLISFLSKESPEYLALSMICYCCFMRPKEIVLLKCKDIDLDRQLVHVSSLAAKNDNESFRTIPDDLVPILKGLDYSHPDWYLFGDSPSKAFRASAKKLDSRRIPQWWSSRVRPACGFKQDLKFYSLKDTGITNMLGNGVPINLVQRQADHSSVAMTAIYVGSKPQAAERLRSASIIRKEED